MQSKVHKSGNFLQDNLLKYMIFLSLVLSIGSYFIPSEEIKYANFSSLIYSMVALIIGASSLFFIIFAFSIYQETRNLEKLRVEIEKHDQLMISNIEKYETMRDEVIKEYEDFREIDRRRWKSVLNEVFAMYSEVLYKINEKEEADLIREDLLMIEPLRYLLIAVTEEKLDDSIGAIGECVELISNKDISLSKEIFDVLLETIDFQKRQTELNKSQANRNDALERLRQFRVVASAVRRTYI